MRRRSARLSVFLCASLAGLLALGGAAGAASTKRKPVSGSLSKPGYTVIAFGANGATRSVPVRGHRFRLRPPGDRLTLQLRGPDGRYAGPVVAGTARMGKRAILGLIAGAKLGKIVVRAGKDYAKVRARPPAKWIDPRTWVRARKGVPIGNGLNAGLVGSRKANGPRSDPDLDGVPNALDVDDDGDRILDGYDRSTYKRKAMARASATSNPNPTFPDGSTISTIVSLEPGEAGGGETTNFDGGSSDAQIAASQQENGHLSVQWWTLDAGTGELDCGTLAYCSSSGGATGRLVSDLSAPHSTGQEYPSCCLADGGPLGLLTPTAPPLHPGGSGSGEIQFMILATGATTAEMKAGDVLIEKGKLDGQPVESATSIGFVAATLPVLAEYDDGVDKPVRFSYPASHPPSPVHARPDGHVVLTLTMWRPQRPWISGDPGTGPWIDVGNLAYATQVALFEGVPTMPYGTCPESSYSAMDSSLKPLAPTFFSQSPPTLGAIRYLDHMGDEPASEKNTFTYDLDVTDCLAARGASLAPGTQFGLNFYGLGLADNGQGGEKTETILHSQTDFQLLP